MGHIIRHMGVSFVAAPSMVATPVLPKSCPEGLLGIQE